MNLKRSFFFAYLEKIFIENRIYRHIEKCQTWDEILSSIEDALVPYVDELYRPLAKEDIVHLTEIKIKRISTYDSFRAEKVCRQLQADLALTLSRLTHINDYAIEWYRSLLKKYGKGRVRKTVLATFDTFQKNEVAAKNLKLYVNRKQGFIGYGLKEEEFVACCSDMDEVLVICKNGSYRVVRVAEKLFVEQDILHITLYDRKNTNRLCYNLIYVDGATGIVFAKRFQIDGIIRDKVYNVTPGALGSRVLYLSEHFNGEEEIVTLLLSPITRASKKKFDFNFSQLAIKGRFAKGNILTKHSVYKIQLKEKGLSAVQELELWYDLQIGRITPNGQGQLLGCFGPTDKVLMVFKVGYYLIATYPFKVQLGVDALLLIEKLKEPHLLSVVYYHSIRESYFVKRFVVASKTPHKKYRLFYTAVEACKPILATSDSNPTLLLQYTENANQEGSKRSILYDLEKIALQTVKAQGFLISAHREVHIKLWNPKSSDI